MDWVEQMKCIESKVSIEDDSLKNLAALLREYVTSNIPGPGADIKLFEVQFAGCDCKGECDDGCNCITRCGRNYCGDTLIDRNEGLYSRPVYECNQRCSCSPSCTNRNVQRGIRFSLHITKVNNCGLGVKTLEFIPRNRYICEYVGEVLDEEAARERTRTRNWDDANYLLVIQEHVQETIKTFIDPVYKGNVARFINHSCNPNMHLVTIRVNNDVPKACLFALCDINAGEELTFHYSGDSELNSDLERKSLTECRCGSENCSGYLPFHPDVFAT